jgi:molecular chaperone DnaK
MQITIQASGGLSDEEIDRMMKEAEENAESDKQRRELVEAKNQAEGLIHATEKSVEEHGDKVDDETKETITTAITDLKEVLEGEDAEVIQQKSQALAEASMKLGEAIYKEQAEAAETAGAEAAEQDAQRDAGDDGVVDAEFTDVTDDDRKAS